MAVLIVDDESNTRQALRMLLTQLGQKTILEARHGLEALKIIDAQKSRIRLVIADADMPYLSGSGLLQKVAERPELDLAPFLMITSDLSRGALAGLIESNPRLDFCLTKPFRNKSLAVAIRSAQQARVRNRSHILVIGGQEWDRPWQMLFSNERETHWTHWQRVDTQQAMKEALENNRQIGAIAVDPVLYSQFKSDRLALFKKTVRGTLTPLACLGRNPAQIGVLRLHCQIFVEGKDIDHEELLSRMASRALTSADLETLSAQAKTALQTKDYKVLEKVAEQMLELDPLSGDANSLMGEALQALSQQEKALKFYLRSVQSNPCSPRPYLKLLEFVTDPSLIHNAIQYCPGNQDVLRSAVRAFERIGLSNESQAILDRRTESQP